MLNINDDKLFLTVDAGTTNIKAAIVAGNGSLIDLEKMNTSVIMSKSGYCEMDMDFVWKQVVTALTSLYSRNKAIWQNICALGVCAQGDGAWPIDKNGNPVRNAILWNDTRAVETVDYKEINKLCLSLDTVSLFPGAAPVILKWLKDNETESYDKTAYVLHCSDWINYKLTGQAVTDYTNASTALMNIYTKEYANEILNSMGILEKAAAFPPVVASDKIIGNTTDEVTKILHFSDNIPVIAGAIDVLAVAAGCGLESAGQKGTIAGTTLCNYVVLDENGAKNSFGEVGSVLCHPNDGKYIRLMAALSGTSFLDWVRREVLEDKNITETENAIANIPIGCDGVIAHPYIFGERAPFALPAACAGFYGLRAHHTKYHMARAAYEAMALSLKDCYNSLPEGDNELYIAGGAAKSDFICQMIADCMGQKTFRLKENELGIKGVYYLLLKALDMPKCIAAEIADVYEPDFNANYEYNKTYQSFCDLKQLMIGFWKTKKLND